MSWSGVRVGLGCGGVVLGSGAGRVWLWWCWEAEKMGLRLEGKDFCGERLIFR